MNNAKCLKCRCDFYVRPCRLKTVKYCSTTCKYSDDENWKGEINATCIKCEKKFHVKPRNLSTAKYCSKKCMDEFRSHYANCKVCGIEYKKSLVYWGKYCSKKCSDQFRAERFSGKNSNLYKDGWTLYRKIYGIENIKKCEICKSEKYLDIHHINCDKKNSNRDNLICVCRSCHKYIHKFIDQGKNPREALICQQETQLGFLRETP